MRLSRSTGLRRVNTTVGLCLGLLAGVPGLVLASDDKPTPVSASVPSSALRYVQDRHLGESLGWLGYQVASRTVIFTTLIETVGRTKAQEIVQNELQYLQPHYQQAWDRNLAAAYAASFTAQELKALDAGDPPPEIAGKLRAKQREVGADMKGRSSELLQVYVSTALDNAVKKAKP